MLLYLLWLKTGLTLLWVIIVPHGLGTLSAGHLFVTDLVLMFSVEGTVISDPILTTSGALFSRPEIGVEFEYHVEPEEDDDDDDDDDDEEEETDFVCSTVYAVPRLNLRRGIVDFLIPPKLDSRPAKEIASHFPKGSTVTVFYNPEVDSIYFSEYDILLASSSRLPRTLVWFLASRIRMGLYSFQCFYWECHC